MATYNLITDPIKLNEFRFYRENPAPNPSYATKPFDGFSTTDTLLPWMMKNTFMHKKLFNDTCTVYIQTQANFVGTALPYPDLQLLDINNNVLADLSVLPFIKGAQQVSGNTIYNPNTNTDVQANTYCWQFRFQDLITTDNSGIYRLRCINTASDGESAINFITEPIFVFGLDASVAFPNTVLIACYNNSNNNYIGYIRDGWDDETFFPVFRHRVCGYLTEYEPKSVYIGMLEQEYQPNKIFAQNYRSFKFEHGGAASPGTTDWEHEKVAEAVISDVFTMDGKRYMLDQADTDAGVKNLWQTIKPQTANKRWPAVILREYKNWQYIFFDQVANPCSCPTLTSVVILFDGVSYSAKFTFDLPDGITCPFTITAVATFTGVFNIDSLSDLVFVSGDTYYKQFLIGGADTIGYTVTKFGGATCYSGTATHDCSGPVFVPSLRFESDTEMYIDVDYSDCGDDCHTVDWTCTQILPPSGTPDEVIFTDTVTCPAPYTSSHLLEPAGYDIGETVRYRLVWTDCCGNTGTTTIEYVPPCVCPTLIDIPPFTYLFSMSGSPVSGGKIVYESDDCDIATCELVTITYLQINTGIVGTPDSGTLTGYNLCAQNFFPVSPNTSYPAYAGSYTGAGRPIYQVSVENACEDVFSGNTHDDVP